MKIKIQNGWTLLIIFSSLLFILTISYAIWHKVVKGEEIFTLSSTEIVELNKIYNNIDDREISDLRKQIIYKRKFIQYISDAYPTIDSNKIKKSINSIGYKDFNSILSIYKFKKESYFWLSGNMVLLEVLFLSLIGLLCSFLFHISQFIRNNEYDNKELPIYYAKFFYSPLITIIIYLSIIALTSTGDLSFIDHGFGIIILSFILGFFSRRTMELLDRIKDLILPKSPSDRQVKKEETKTNDSENPYLKLTLPEQREILKQMIVEKSDEWEHQYPHYNGDVSIHKYKNEDGKELYCLMLQVDEENQNVNDDEKIPENFKYKDFEIFIKTEVVEETEINYSRPDYPYTGELTHPPDLGSSISVDNKKTFGTLGFIAKKEMVRIFMQ
jgi:hypothetical protein